MSKAAVIMEMPTFGRPFQLGMLYDATSDRLIQGNELWDKETLQKAQQDKPFLDTQCTVIVDDSLATKCRRLGANSAPLKANLLTGMTRVSGAAMFLTDHQATREVARVSIQFKCSSHTQELDIQQLGQIQNETAISATRATHVVTKALFGLKAFLIVDRPYSTEENVTTIQRKLSSTARLLAKLYESGQADFAEIDKTDTAKYSFKFYCDATLPVTSPTTIDEVVATLNDTLFKLFKQGGSCSCLVPKKVWLYPLCELDSSAPSVVTEVSTDIAAQIEKVTDDLIQAEVWVSDIYKHSPVAISFQEQQSRLAGLISQFQDDVRQRLSTIVINVRNGSAETSQLVDFLKQVEISPFGSKSLTFLLKGLKLEFKAVSQFLSSLTSDSVKCVSSDEIDELAIDFDYILSFEFRLGGTSTVCLTEMEEYLHTRAISAQSKAANSKPWYKDGSRKRAIQLKAKVFKEFALTNSSRTDIKFVVHINSDSPSPSKEVAAVILYADDEPTEFDLPSKPTNLHIKKDTGEEVHLTWNEPKYGETNVTSYIVSFHPVEDTSEHVTLEADEATDSIIVQDLDPETEYQFTVQAECTAGLGPKSDPLVRKPAKKRSKEPVLSKKQKKKAAAAAASTAGPGKKPEDNSGSSGQKNKRQKTADASKNPHYSSASNTGPIVLTLPPSRMNPHLLQSFDPIELMLPPSESWPSLSDHASEPSGAPTLTTGSQPHHQGFTPVPPMSTTHGQTQLVGPVSTTTFPASPPTISLSSTTLAGATQPQHNYQQSVPSHPAVSHQMLEQTELVRTAPILSVMPSPQKTEGASVQSSLNPASQSSPQLPSRTGAEAVPATARLSYSEVTQMPSLELHHPTDKVPITESTGFATSFGKPQPKNVTYKSIGLEWKRPFYGRNSVQYYSVLYHIDGASDSTLREKKTNGPEEHINIDGLSCETGYVFRIQVTFSSGIKLESEPTGPIRTKAHLAETIRLKSKQISEKTPKKPAIYELTKVSKMFNNQKRMAKFEVGEASQGESVKVLMVVGATGAGKTTLINGIANYMYGVQWEDDFRFVLVANEPAKKSQAHSQTSWITAYTLHRGDQSPIPYSLIIIDTPGFGDTEGIERDKKIADQIKDFFSVRPPEGIDILHGIGFVAQASLARLSPSQQYIFDSILSIYGRDVASNIFMMTTFADGQDPPVMEAIKVANIPHQTYFKFNNSALFVTGKEDSFDAMFWKMGMKSFVDFFSDFGRAEHRSLQLTREVLSEREQLENVLKELQPQIHAGLTKMDELQRVVTMLEHNKSLIEQNKEFVFTVSVTKQRMIDTPPGQYTTNCLNCNFTCHENCAYANNQDKRHCCAMDGHGSCTVCPGNCIWSKHVNNPYIFELYDEEEVRTSSELKDRYDTAREGESRAETMIANIKDELNTLEIIVLEQVDKARKSLMRLDDIALKPNPLSEVDYIDQLIKSEEQQCKLGWQERVNAYKTLRKRASLMRKIKDPTKVVNQHVFTWLREDGTGGAYAPATLDYLKNPQHQVAKKKTWYQFWK